jgi:hypothetical protein
MGDAGCQWNYLTDWKRKKAAISAPPPIQTVEARKRTQNNEHSGPQPPHPSIEREAVWSINPNQRALPEGTAGWRKDTSASIDGHRIGQCASAVEFMLRLLQQYPVQSPDWDQALHDIMVPLLIQ